MHDSIGMHAYLIQMMNSIHRAYFHTTSKPIHIQHCRPIDDPSKHINIHMHSQFDELKCILGHWQRLWLQIALSPSIRIFCKRLFGNFLYVNLRQVWHNNGPPRSSPKNEAL